MLACIRKLVLVHFKYAETELIPVFRDGRLTQAWSKSFPWTKRQLYDIVKANGILLWNLSWDSWESNLSLVQLEECGGTALWGSLQENGSTAERDRFRSGEELHANELFKHLDLSILFMLEFSDTWSINHSSHTHTHTHTLFSYMLGCESSPVYLQLKEFCQSERSGEGPWDLLLALGHTVLVKCGESSWIYTSRHSVFFTPLCCLWYSPATT